MSEDLLYANGINAETGRYDVPPMTPEEFAESLSNDRPDTSSQHFLTLKDKWDTSPRNRENEVPDTPKPRGFLGASDDDDQQSSKPRGFLGPAEGVDPKDLAQTGWGVIFADTIGDDVKEALSELLQYRKEQAGDLYREYYLEGRDKEQFMAAYEAGSGPVDPKKIPYYLLLVGNPTQIPYVFQYQMDVQYAVGRIHFDQLEDYQRYAHSVVMVEQGKVSLPRQATFFGVQNEDDPATQMSAANLVTPLAGKVQDEFGWQTRVLLKDDAHRANLEQVLGGTQTPTFLMSASHGMAFPKDDPRQIPHQGALLCQDWPGPKQHKGSIPEEWYLAGDHISSDAKLLGMMAFFFACYGAGTPATDEFARKSLSQAIKKDIAAQPFLADLPKRMLAHPNGGALAVVGHVERAWAYSFMGDQMARNAEIEVFRSTLYRLLKDGHPIGSAVEYFNERYAEISTALMIQVFTEIDFGKKEPRKFAWLWTASNDARNYAIIGDPAVRLPVNGNGGGANGEHPTMAFAPTITGTPTGATPPASTSTTSAASTASTASTPPSDSSEGASFSASGGDNSGSGSGSGAAPTLSQTRVINCWIDGLLPEDTVTLGTTYELMLNVDGPRDDALATAAEPATANTPNTSDPQDTEIVVQLATDDYTIYGDSDQIIFVPKQGASKNQAIFTIEPKHAGSCTLTASCSVNGTHLHDIVVSLQATTTPPPPQVLQPPDWSGSTGKSGDVFAPERSRQSIDTGDILDLLQGAGGPYTVPGMDEIEESVSEDTERVINAWLHGNKKADTLQRDTTYALKFDVDAPNIEAIATSASIETAMRDMSPDQDTATIQVLLDSDDFTIYGKQSQTLVVPREGASKNTITFAIAPRRDGPCHINAMCSFNGKLFQHMTLSFHTGERDASEPAEATATFRGKSLGSVMARPVPQRAKTLNLVILPGNSGYRCILQNGGVVRAWLNAETDKIAELINHARETFLDIAHTRVNGTYVYTQENTTIPQDVYAASIQKLAELGGYLYEQLFFGPGNGPDAHAMGRFLREFSQQHALNVQVAAEKFVFPWALLYDRELPITGSVDPEGFWGFKHTIEYMPEFSSSTPVNFDPVITIADDTPLTMGFLYNTTIDDEMKAPIIQNQRSFYPTLPHIQVNEYATTDDLYSLLLNEDAPEHLLYFYCHAVSNSPNEKGGVQGSKIELSDGAARVLDLNTKAPPSKPRLKRAPFVFLNACQSAELSPFLYDGLVPYLLSRGIRGVLGTEIDTPAMFAAEFAREFLRRFTAGGSPIGEILLNLRREYVLEKRNVMGLLYALYSSGDVMVVRGEQSAAAAFEEAAAQPERASIPVVGITSTATQPTASQTSSPTPEGTTPAPGTLGIFGGGSSRSEDESASPFAQVAEELANSLQTLANKITDTTTNVIQDATVLSVKTYVSPDEGITRSAKTLGTLRAVTYIKLDGDVVESVPVNKDGEIDETLMRIHNETVERAQAHRAEMVKVLVSAAAELLKVVR